MSVSEATGMTGRTNGCRWWYGPILPSDDSFPFASRQTLTGFLLAVSSHLSRKRPADTFLNFLTNATSIFIVFLSELSNALMAPEAAGMDTPGAIHLYLEENPDSNLANVLDRKQQEKKFKAVAEDILETFLDSKAYNCEPVRVFLREVLAGLILEMTLKSCSKPEWVNGWVVYLLEDGEPEIMNAIDAGVGSATNKEMKNVSAQQVPNKHPSPHNDPESQPGRPSIERASTHKRNISKAEDAMEEAMLEAKRLTELIILEDAKNNRKSEEAASPIASGTAPTSHSESAFPDGTSTTPIYGTSLGARTSTSDDAISSGHATGHNFTPTSSQSDLNGGSNHLDSAPEDEATVHPREGPVTFDRILPAHQLAASDEQPKPQAPPPLTLHNASVTIFDDAMPGEKATNIIRAKPNIDYLLQVEPASSQHPGWMMARKYADFETLHEILGKISVVSGVTAFTRKHSSAPTWKGQTKDSLRRAMETYLRDALSHPPLAESEGMKRFLEKDQTLGRLSGSSGKGLLGFPSPTDFENMGKGMLDVLASAPKGVAGGGKAIFEGVTGVFGQKKPALPARPSNSGRPASITSTRSRTNTLGDDRLNSPSPSHGRISQEIRRSSTDTERQKSQLLQSYGSEIRSPSMNANSTTPTKVPNSAMRADSLHEEAPLGSARSINGLPLSEEPSEKESKLHLPPLPSEIPDDYASEIDSPRASVSTNNASTFRSSVSSAPMSAQRPSDGEQLSAAPPIDPPTPPRSIKQNPEAPPLTEQETQVAVELFFAMINELYTLSSAWQIRRTILNAAKTFLLRPGNPNLEAIRVLIQDTIIEANTSDTGLALQLIKLRENSLPTEEELKLWPAELTGEEKETLRVKARKLLIERGMPQALTSVMGAAASGEALGRVFDSLQCEDVARGLMFAVMLQGVRALTH